MMVLDLIAHTTKGAVALPGHQQDRWHLEFPAGRPGSYRLAQIDDYAQTPRSNFPHEPPLELNLRSRVSAPDIPGTWGFGFWNDPFSLSLNLGGGARRFPVLPNAAWFFYASSQNYLSFQDHLPANGFIAQTFRSKSISPFVLGLASPMLPLLFSTWLAQKIRIGLRRMIQEESFAWNLDVTDWHDFSLIWNQDQVCFKVDDSVFETRISPGHPLGLVIWIDNQYAAFPPNGKLSFGTLETPRPAWLEVENLSLRKS